MLIREKGLLRLMKNAYRGQYCIEENDGVLIIWTERWAVMTHLEDLPRKVLALIVEHMGDIPQGITITVGKDLPNQTAISRTLEEKFRDRIGGISTLGDRIPLIYDNRYQCYRLRTGEAVAMDLEMQQLLGDEQYPMRADPKNGYAAYIDEEKQDYILIPIQTESRELLLAWIREIDWAARDAQ